MSGYTDEAIVHERHRPSVPFGFRKDSGMKWTPSGPERHIRDEATVKWAQEIRKRP